MTALYIIGGILLFIFLILMIPLSFHFRYDGEPELFLRYLFIKIKLIPPKEKKKKVTDEKNKEDKKQSEKGSKKQEGSFKRLYKKRGFDGLIQIIKEVTLIVKNASTKILKHTVVKKLKIDLVIVGDDAGDTAMKYGYVCAAIYPAVSILDSNIKIKHKEIDILPGFNEDKMKILVESKVNIRSLFLLHTMISAAFKGIKLILGIRNDIE